MYKVLSGFHDAAALWVTGEYRTKHGDEERALIRNDWMFPVISKMSTNSSTQLSDISLGPEPA